jgi:4-hydroxy-4-methyl-2-oxoglutarate aldolase
VEHRQAAAINGEYWGDDTELDNPSMIDDAPLLTLHRPERRPSAAQISVFAEVPTGFVVDALGGGGALAPEIKPVVAEQAHFVGVALPCHCRPDDNLAVFGALTLGQAGDVILAAADGYRGAAVTGDNLLGMARNAGVVAFVTDGCVRDRKGIAALGLPCFATGLTPNSPARNGPGTAGLPVVLGGVAVVAGDLVIGDEEGVVIVPFSRIDETITRLASVREAEAALEARVKAGLVVPDFIAPLLLERPKS